MQGAAVILELEASPDRLIGAEPIGVALFKTSRQDRMRSASAATAEEDDRLLGEIAGGSNQALAQLMERHLGRVFSLALRITGSRSDAEDAAQEVFTRVWRKAAEWTPGDARFSTWLYRVTMNLCIDVRRRPRAEQLDPDLPVADAGPGAEALLIEREQEVQVRAAMNALPERQREAMALCYTLGLSNAAAAEVMEISLKAYESLLVRAKRDIRARLEGLES